MEEYKWAMEWGLLGGLLMGELGTLASPGLGGGGGPAAPRGKEPGDQQTPSRPFFQERHACKDAAEGAPQGLVTWPASAQLGLAPGGGGWALSPVLSPKRASSLSHLSSRAHTAFWHRCSSNPHCVPSGSFPGIRQSIGQTPTQRLSFLNAPPIAHIIPTGRPSSVPWLVPPPLGTGGAGEAGVLGRGLGAEP